MRYALRIDANQAQVISALEGAGCKVDVISKPTDLLVGYTTKAGKAFAFFEVKDGNKSPSQRKKTPAQNKFFDRWDGFPVCLVDSPECALRHLRVLQS